MKSYQKHSKGSDDKAALFFLILSEKNGSWSLCWLKVNGKTVSFKDFSAF